MLPRAPAAGDPPRRERTLERPGSSRKDPGLKFKIHAQPRPDPPTPAASPRTLGQLPLSRPSPPHPQLQVMGHLLPGYVGWLREDPAGDPRAPGESEQPQPARAHTRTHTQTHSRECVYVPNVGWENNGEPLGLRDHPPPSHQPCAQFLSTVKRRGERRSSDTPPWDVEVAKGRLAWRRDKSSNG